MAQTLVPSMEFAQTLNKAANVSQDLYAVPERQPPLPPRRFAVSDQPSTRMTTNVVGQESRKSPKPHGKDSQPRGLPPPPPITFVSVGAHPEGEYPGGDTYHTLFAKIRAFQGELNSSQHMVMLLTKYIENYEHELRTVLSYHLPNSEKEVQFLIAKIEGFRNTVAYYKTLVSNLRHLIRLATAELDRNRLTTAELDRNRLTTAELYRNRLTTAELYRNSFEHGFMSVINTKF